VGLVVVVVAVVVVVVVECGWGLLVLLLRHAWLPVTPHVCC
jgi:hypothetical protein